MNTNNSADANNQGTQGTGTGANASGNQTGNRTRTNARNRGDNNANSFVPKLPTVESLGTLKENRRQNFKKFQKSIHHHVMTTYKNSKDMSKCIIEFVHPVPKIEREVKTLSAIRGSNSIYSIVPPPANETNKEKFDREQENADRRDMVKTIYNQHIKNISKRIQVCEQNMTVLWADIIGNCSLSLQEELSGDPLYLTKSSSFDSIWLLQTLHKITAGANKTTNKYYSIFKSIKAFYNTQQGPNEPLDAYYQRFENAKDLVDLFDGKVVDLSTVLSQEQSINSSTTEDDVQQRFMSMCLILNANKKNTKDSGTTSRTSS